MLLIIAGSCVRINHLKFGNYAYLLYYLQLVLYISHFISKWGFLKLFIYLFIYGCVGSSFLCEGFL